MPQRRTASINRVAEKTHQKKNGRAYPKCVPAAKAAGMSESQKKSAVARKRSKRQGVGGKPTMVKTFAAKGGAISKNSGLFGRR